MLNDNFLNQLVYNMIKGAENMFMPFGMEINKLDVKFYDNSNFPLLGKTCAFFDLNEDTININIEDDFVKENTEQKIFFLLLHEISHKFLCHFARGTNKNHLLFNMAQDYEIHNLLYTYRDIVRENGYKDFVNYFNELDNFLFCENTDFCFDKKYLEFTAEEIYFKLLENQKNVKSESMECDFNGTEVEISETTDNKGHKSVTVKNKKSGDDTGNENSNDNSNGNKQMQDKINKQRMLDGISKELNKIKERGLNSVNTNIILKKLNHVKVDWERILRDSLLTELEKGDDYSWQSLRPSMFQNGIALPNLSEDYQKYGTLIIQRDESGSMNNNDLQRCAKIIADSKEYFTKIVLIKHDSEISKVSEYEELTEDLIKDSLKRESIGGTSHKPVFEFVRDYTKKHDENISMFIGLTDLCSDIQENQDIMPNNIPVFWITNTDFITSEKVSKGIRGQIINMEV